MATEENKITVDSTFRVKIGGAEIALTREKAEELYGQLYQALGKADRYYQWVYPSVTWGIDTKPTLVSHFQYYR